MNMEENKKDNILKDQEKEDKKKETEEMEILKKKEEEYQSLWDKYLRVCAEFDNARKRWDKEKQEIIKFANFKLMKELVVILDELEAALNNINNKDVNKIIEGINLTYKNLLDVLKRFGLKPIEAKGKKFDPHYHEIVAHKEVEDDEEEHLVLEEVQRGYLLENKLLRTSKVIVGVKKKNLEKGNETTGGDKNG